MQLQVDLECHLQDNNFHTRYSCDKYRHYLAQVVETLRKELYKNVPRLCVEFRENPLPKKYKDFFQMTGWYRTRPGPKEQKGEAPACCPTPPKLVRYPRLGAFEVIIRCSPDMFEERPCIPATFEAWSKLTSHLWPNPQNLALNVASVLRQGLDGEDVSGSFERVGGPGSIQRLKMRSSVDEEFGRPSTRATSQQGIGHPPMLFGLGMRRGLYRPVVILHPEGRDRSSEVVQPQDRHRRPASASMPSTSRQLNYPPRPHTATVQPHFAAPVFARRQPDASDRLRSHCGTPRPGTRAPEPQPQFKEFEVHIPAPEKPVAQWKNLWGNQFQPGQPQLDALDSMEFMVHTPAPEKPVAQSQPGQTQPDALDSIKCVSPSTQTSVAPLQSAQTKGADLPQSDVPDSVRRESPSTQTPRVQPIEQGSISAPWTGSVESRASGEAPSPKPAPGVSAGTPVRTPDPTHPRRPETAPTTADASGKKLAVTWPATGSRSAGYPTDLALPPQANSVAAVAAQSKPHAVISTQIVLSPSEVMSSEAVGDLSVAASLREDTRHDQSISSDVGDSSSRGTVRDHRSEVQKLADFLFARHGFAVHPEDVFLAPQFGDNEALLDVGAFSEKLGLIEDLQKPRQCIQPGRLFYEVAIAKGNTTTSLSTLVEELQANWPHPASDESSDTPDLKRNIPNIGIYSTGTTPRTGKQSPKGRANTSPRQSAGYTPSAQAASLYKQFEEKLASLSASRSDSASNSVSPTESQDRSAELVRVPSLPSCTPDSPTRVPPGRAIVDAQRGNESLVEEQVAISKGNTKASLSPLAEEFQANWPLASAESSEMPDLKHPIPKIATAVPAGKGKQFPRGRASVPGDTSPRRSGDTLMSQVASYFKKYEEASPGHSADTFTAQEASLYKHFADNLASISDSRSLSPSESHDSRVPWSPPSRLPSRSPDSQERDLSRCPSPVEENPVTGNPATIKSLSGLREAQSNFRPAESNFRPAATTGLNRSKSNSSLAESEKNCEGYADDYEDEFETDEEGVSGAMHFTMKGATISPYKQTLSRDAGDDFLNAGTSTMFVSNLRPGGSDSKSARESPEKTVDKDLNGNDYDEGFEEDEVESDDGL